MVGVARPCPLFAKIVDRLAPISAETASAFKSAGVEAVGRYLENLSPSERDSLFAAGLGILPLSKAPVGALDDAFGRSRSIGLLQRTVLLDVPPSVHVMIDLEAQQASASDAIAYDSALSAGLAGGGYIPLAYVGANQPLTGQQLFQLPDVHLYWRGGSLGIPEPACGFALWQIPPLESPVANAIVDVSVAGADLRGRRPVLWYPN